jgi:hypothetical protein
MSNDKYPPFTQIGMASLALIVAGGIYLSSHLPQHVALGPAIGLLAASAILLGLNFASLLRVPDFAWPRFLQVAKWSLLAYAIISGLILYAFLQDHVSGGALVILTLSLVVFTLEVPAMIGFTVARYANTQPIESTGHPAA